MANRYFVVRTEYYTDWYTEDGEGGGGWRKFKSTYNGFTEQVIWVQSDYYAYEFLDRSGEVNRSGGGGKGPYGNTYTGIVSREEATIKKIEDRNNKEIIKDVSFEGSKADCVFEKLNSGSKSFRQMIRKFDGTFPVAHLTLSIVHYLPGTVSAVTNNSATHQIEIKINGNTILNRTTLGLARTLAHETIHAELYRKVRSVGGQVSIDDYPGIYDYYRRHIKNWQHEQMAAHYRGTIVEILKDYDNNGNTNQFYNDIAWEGLHGTVAWNNLNPTERARIINQINTYKDVGNKNCN